MESVLAELSNRVRAAAAAGQALRIEGGGSKAFYGEAATRGEPLSTTALQGIVSYEPSELVVTVRAGTPLAQLEAALAEHGQCLPFEPPHFGGSTAAQAPSDGAPLHGQSAASGSAATVGGMVAAGLSGPARACVGAVRDYVLGAQMINGRGELLSFGGQVMKNVAGYDVSRLLVGSLGTLGLITQVSLKVLPVAPSEATLRFTGLAEAQAIECLNRWAGQPLPLNASSWLPQAGTPTLYLRLRGAHAAVEAACQRLLQAHGGERADSAQTTADWQAARDLRLPWFADGLARGRELWRLSVPATTAPLALGDTLIEWLGAQRWLWLAPGDVQGAGQVRAAAQAAGGSATLFMPAGQPTAATRLHPLAPTLARIHAALKREFDPAGIFNPGRLYPDF